MVYLVGKRLNEKVIENFGVEKDRKHAEIRKIIAEQITGMSGMEIFEIGEQEEKQCYSFWQD